MKQAHQELMAQLHIPLTEGTIKINCTISPANNANEFNLIIFFFFQ